MLINHRAVADIGRVDGDAGMCLAQRPRQVPPSFRARIRKPSCLIS